VALLWQARISNEDVDPKYACADSIVAAAAGIAAAVRPARRASAGAGLCEATKRGRAGRGVSD
jgi:hypothetical protein